MVTTITISNDGPISWSTDWESLIKQEIEQRFAHAHVAQTYSYLIRLGYQDWATLNPLIIARYGKSGFKRIKELAWKRVEADNAESNHGT